MANAFLVRKANHKWHICVDFKDLNVAYLKDPYLLPYINRLIDRSSGYQVMSFMDAYLEYNLIKIDLLDASKIAFMSN